MSSENYDRFFPEPRETGYMATVAAAVAICRTCPIQAPCLLYAQSIPDVYGIWGGRVFTPSQKRRRPTKGVEPPTPSPEPKPVVVRPRKRTGTEELERTRVIYEEYVEANNGAVLPRRRRRRPSPPR